MEDKSVLVQLDMCEKLEKAITNFKKTPKDRLKQPYLETRLQSLEELYKDFKVGHRELIVSATTFVKSNSKYFTDDKYDWFEEAYISYKSLINEKLSTFIQDIEQHSTINSQQCAEVKLPRIELPKFGGKYEEWQSFHDMFVSLILNNERLSGVQKLHYLKCNLSGEAEKLLRNLPTTEQNFSEAWKQMKNRYDNKRYNCNTILKILFAQKSITTESAHAIKLLLDTTSSSLKALNNMGINTESWDVLIVYLVVSKLDSETHKLWEQKLSTTNDLPTWEQLLEFLEARFRSLEMIDSGRHITTKTHPIRQTVKTTTFHAAVSDEQMTETFCVICNGQHRVHLCKKFGQQEVRERRDIVHSKGLCFNCLSPSHVVFKCRQPTCCKKCGRRHHTMLHVDKDESTSGQRTDRSNNIHRHNEKHTHTKRNENEPQSNTVETKVITNFAKKETQGFNVLLATAVVKARAKNGRRHLLRALLDQGSQASFVTESTAQLLGLKRTSVNGVVSGLGDGETRIKYTVSFTIESRHNPENSVQINAYVLGTLTSMLPSDVLEAPSWLRVDEMPLADPDYTTPGKIDILLGAEVYGEILLNGMVKSPQGNLIAQNTVLGWVLSGRISNISRSNNVISMHINMTDELLKRFWEIEAEPNRIQKPFTKEEERCENIYEATTERNEEGRYIVRLPFASEDPQSQYGQSREIATRKLWSLERRLQKDIKLYDEYRKVLEEYITLNHMALVEKENIDNPKAVYLPHHAVVRNDKLTTKVRVVFNASSKGVNNVSLNDDLLVGPKIQQDLRHLLMRWRIHPICIIADLVKMYRQVRVHEADTEFQRIVWRPDFQSPIQHYKLLTLTFGTACAPYLAVKTLHRLSENEKDRFPVAAEITKRDCYVDDIMTGCESVEEALKIYNEMNGLMKAGGFELQKWNSNSNEFLQHVSMGHYNSDKAVSIKSDNTLKVLGIRWNRDTDNFEYTVDLPELQEPITKRQVLSDIARLYDPMGWIAPIIIVAKIIMQKLWKAQLDWDELLPKDLLHEWLQYRDEITQIKNIKIPRWVRYRKGHEIQLHAFSDASRSAFAACVYLRVIDKKDTVYVSLVSAKTKVAPIIKEVTIPRLELCGATLAAKLLSEIGQVMGIPKKQMFAWTDSTIVLAWLKGGASRWSTFVSNRVSEILTNLDFEQWGHVSTNMNPADCASRGLRPADLEIHDNWWNGPCFLKEIKLERGINNILETNEEIRTVTLKINDKKEENLVWMKFSDLGRMLRIISYCRRIMELRKGNKDRKHKSKFVTTEEMNETLYACIRQEQEICFKKEIEHLKKGQEVVKGSLLYTLYPILDKTGLLRVGGRIDLAQASFEKRHPIIIAAKSHLSILIIADAHKRTLHGGPQVMLNYLRSKYWIIRARNQVKTYYKKCVTCTRHSKSNQTQLMGQIPEVRLIPSKPFKSAGVDYAGPINIRFSPGRGAISYKGYICLFVCMVTRAIHLEVVSNLTAQGFIAAFRRFTSRRGHCQNLYSDNGTNFVGANKQLHDMFNRAKSKLPEEIAQMLTIESTTWHFIPPNAPNFGGTWEAGVRSAKTHLIKVIGDSTLTFEELSTLLTQVEACLNSRPLTVLSDNPVDPLPLTPGHFLVGEPILNLSDENYCDYKTTGLERFKLVQKMLNDFWKRWSREYLVSLNQRYKWNSTKPEPEIDDIVIVKDDNLPPAKWILGRIIIKHTGPDKITRVVSIKCKNGILKRPLSKLCVLDLKK